MTISTKALGVCALAIAPLAACVSQAKYDALKRTANLYKKRSEDCAAESAKQKKTIAALEKKTKELTEELDKLKGELASCKTESAQTVARLKQLDAELATMKKMLDTYKGLATRFKGSSKKRKAELARLQQEILALQKHFAARLKQTRKAMAELAKARAEAEKRARMYRSLTREFRKLIDSGQLSVGLVHGRMVIKLGSAVLFDSGKAMLKVSGKRVLDKVAQVLKRVKGRHFQVAGHTDNRPIRISRFRSNWDLSVARALQVVKHLQKQGVPPDSLSVGGFSQYQPVSTNKTPAGRRANRRIEISLVPSIPKHLLEK